MTYFRMLVNEYGGPEALIWSQAEKTSPEARQLCIKTEAAGVAFGDILWMSGTVPVGPKTPFTPGYDLVGTVEEIGAGVEGFEIGQRVAGLVRYGGYSEYLCEQAKKLVPVPESLEPTRVAASTLNYLTAYALMKRIANLDTGQSVLMHGASGGAGTAVLDLARHFGITAYGTASNAKHDLVSELGGIPIDYHSEDFVARINDLKPEGVDLVVDHIGGNHFARSFSVLAKGGVLVGTSSYGAILGDMSRLESMLGFMRLSIWNMLPNGKRAVLFDVAPYYHDHLDEYQVDLSLIFDLLQEGKIDPTISHQLPLKEAAQGMQLLLDKEARGKVVLTANK